MMLFMRDGIWGVLDLIAMCVSWCAIALYITVDGLRGSVVAGEGYGYSQVLRTS